MNYFAQRRQTLTKDFKKDGIDTFLVSNPVHVTYLTGFSGSSSYVVGTAKQFVLISDDRYAEQIKEEVSGVEVHIRPHTQTVTDAVGEVLGSVGAKMVGVEADHATFAFVDAVKSAAPKAADFKPIYGKLEAMRVVKDPSELEHIREAVHIAERAFVMFKAMLREADTEKDLVDAMEGYVRRAGGTRTPFQPICAVGERGALPHAPPSRKQLNEGSKLLVDWGAEWKGYKSDLTRTLRSPFSVAPSRRNKMERVGYKLEKLHGIVLQAQQAALAVIRDGTPAAEVDAAARQVIADAGYEEYFTHGLGHGIGLDTHESPRLRPNSEDVLSAGMVITVEPGIYIPGWGGVRIEDDVLVTREGYTLLSTLSREINGQDASEE
jgi:Xaa-Pro aminopeptidase